MPQRLRAGPRQHQFLSEPFERGFKGDEILRRIVHQKNLDSMLRWSLGVARILLAAIMVSTPGTPDAAILCKLPFPVNPLSSRLRTPTRYDHTPSGSARLHGCG